MANLNVTVTVEMLSGPKAGTRFRLKGERAVIGRGTTPDIDIQLPECPSISTSHAEISIRQDGVWISDLGSRNGIFVNGDKVQELRLDAESRIRLGQESFCIHLESLAVAAAQSASPSGARVSGDLAAGVFQGGSLSQSDQPASALELADEQSGQGSRFVIKAVFVVALIAAAIYGIGLLSSLKPNPDPYCFIVRISEIIVVKQPDRFMEWDTAEVEPNTGLAVIQPFKGMVGEQNAVVIKGANGEGNVVVTLKKNGKQVSRFKVMVRGKMHLPIDDVPENLSTAEVAELARKYMAEADATPPDKLYTALKKLDMAAELFRRALLLQEEQAAVDKRLVVERKLQEMVRSLYDAARSKMAGGIKERPDFQAAYNLLEEIKMLLPDKQNIDWQFVNLIQAEYIPGLN